MQPGMTKSSMQRQNHKIPKFVAYVFSGVGIFLGFMAIIQLVILEFEVFFGLIFMGVIFFGLGWAIRKVMLTQKSSKPVDIGNVAGTIFGGVGLVIVFSSILFFFDGDIESAIFMFIFGSVFIGAGYLAYRMFRTPEGKKAVSVSERTQNIGRFSQQISKQFTYVDENVSEQQVKRMQDTWSETPWTQRKDWAEGKVIQEGVKNLGFLLAFTILWNLIANGIAGFIFVDEWGSGGGSWFILIFPLVGIILIISTIRTWIRRRKYGIGVLNLDEVPGRLGERLKGVIETGVSADKQPEGGFRLRLRCIERSSHRDSDGDKKVREKELWSEEQQVYGSISSKDFTFALSIYFNLPDDLPQTQIIPKDDRTLWRVESSASTPGVDYAAKFEVPVYPAQS